MAGLVDVIKRGGATTEPFESDKLSRSVYATCLSVSLSKGESNQIAQSVVQDVTDWLDGKEIITTGDIRYIVQERLQTYNPQAAYMYKQYKHII